MSRICVLLLVVAACRGGGTGKDDECKLVTSDPASAMATIAKHHKGDAAAAAEVIERCVAPTGDDCERMEKILPALKTLMPAAGPSPAADRIGELCRQAMTPEMRHCMFPSYTLRHADECAQVLAKLQASHTALELEPSTRKACDVPDITVTIGAKGVDVAGQHRGGALDTAWLEQQLKPLAGGSCPPAVAVHAEAGVRYHDVIAAMDTATKIGLMNVVLDTPGAGSGSAHTPSSPDPDLQHAPAVIVTKTEVLVGSNAVAKIADVLDDAGDYTIPALTKKLPPAQNGVAILQADESTDARVINKVVDTLKAAGFDNVMFAVKKR